MASAADRQVRKRRFATAAAVAAVAVALDQLTKWWMLNVVMTPPRIIEVTPFFNLVWGWNRGISFGLFNEPGGWNRYALPAVAAVVIVALLWWLARVTTLRMAAAIGLIIGGAIGNVVDRIRFGAVFDFLDVHAYGYHWPAFNIADSAITIGVAVILLDAALAPSERGTGGAAGDRGV